MRTPTLQGQFLHDKKIVPLAAYVFQLFLPRIFLYMFMVSKLSKPLYRLGAKGVRYDPNLPGE